LLIMCTTSTLKISYSASKKKTTQNEIEQMIIFMKTKLKKKILPIL